MERQLTIDELLGERNLAIILPEELFSMATADLLQKLEEDNRIERKPAGYRDSDIGTYLSMWANTVNGGLIVIGQDNDTGEFQGLTRCGVSYINDMEASGHTYCPDAIYKTKRIQTNSDFVLLYYVQYNPSRVVRTNRGEVFIRDGESKRQLDAEEIRQLQLDKGEINIELERIQAVYPDDFHVDRIEKFCATVRTAKRWDDTHNNEDILTLSNLGEIKDGQFFPNLACGLLFSKNVRRIVAGSYIRFLRFESEVEGTGTNWNPTKDEFIEGTLPDQIKNCEEILKSQLRTFSRLDKSGRFLTAPEYPEFAWYEGIVNACVHRSYSDGLSNTPVTVKMFSSRLEIESPGGFPPFVTPTNIYDVHRPRNPYLMDAMYYLEFVRCAHEGTRRIRETMREMDLPDPEFRQQDVHATCVRVTLQNNFRKRKPWVDSDVVEIVGMTLAQQLSEDEKRVLAFIAENGEISVTDSMHLTKRSWPASKKLLERLVRKGILSHNKKNPDIDRDPFARYVLNDGTMGDEDDAEA